jgi:hypothetical protein
MGELQKRKRQSLFRVYTLFRKITAPLDTSHGLVPENLATAAVARGEATHTAVGSAERILFCWRHQTLLL